MLPTFIYHSAILPGALNGPHKPKAIVLDLVAKEIAWRSDQYGGDVLANMLLPYVLTNDNFATLAKELFPKEYYKAKVIQTICLQFAHSFYY
jgi:hypothetical protein